MRPLFKIAMVMAAGISLFAKSARAQVGGGAMGGGGMAGAAGGFAGGGLTGGMMGGGMANGNLMGGNLAAGQGSGFGTGGALGANLAATPQMGRGAGMAAAGQSMLQGMPGATMGNMAGGMATANGNNMAFRQGANWGRLQGGTNNAAGMFSGSGMNPSLGSSGNLLYGLQGAQGNNLPNRVFGPSTGLFSSWGRGSRLNFGYGSGGGVLGGYGPVMGGYTGSPMFGGTPRQQMYYNNYGAGGGF